jgi:hypothetical protein
VGAEEVKAVKTQGKDSERCGVTLFSKAALHLNQHNILRRVAQVAQAEPVVVVAR